jgi:hypothetical protein
MVEPWVIRPSGRGWVVVHAETDTETEWFADRADAQLHANQNIIDERTPA